MTEPYSGVIILNKVSPILHILSFESIYNNSLYSSIFDIMAPELA
jgi:hypothetical protein